MKKQNGVSMISLVITIIVLMILASIVVGYSLRKTLDDSAFTRKVSEIIAEQKGADLLEVKDQKSRSGAMGFFMGGFDAIRGKSTSISYDTVDMADYDTVYIGTPVWASKPTPAILEFIRQNDFSNNDVVTFATLGGSGGESTVKAMNEAVSAKGGTVKRSFSFVMKGNDIEQLVLDALNDE